MKFDIITIFPNTLEAIFSESILKRAQEKNIIEINVHDLRTWTNDKRKTVDDLPFGGGPGMVMQIEPIYKALKAIGAYPKTDAKTKLILTSAGGEVWNQRSAKNFAQEFERIVIICGHYEGIDQRVTDFLADTEISIGQYVLTGGELPAAIIVDSISRLIPDVLGNAESLLEESHNALSEGNSEPSKEYPQYTRPAEFVTTEGETWKVPEVLLSGNHAEIAKWRIQSAKKL